MFAVTDAHFDALTGRVDVLFDLVATDRRQMRQGVATALAQAEAPFPPEPGQTGYALRGSTFRGETAFSLGLSHRLNIDAPVTITANVSHSGGKNTGAALGVAGIF
ncbi:hypothetical protein GRI89_03645 [Altererythrobacter salegens]|uniref:Trimeric autotransporter adhesin YadA-like C-terminal membrane anchor domain-containing protein n=1 Tax=Croceibacterium salegens TaxID=1737568 RepID=A0A6I4SRU7_9SPHN|nr:YadA C-terminal domain-containing protein [Croceibacterium salegens]MXO58634.1 hypothetical protein [Croceibacterium salegens]